MWNGEAVAVPEGPNYQADVPPMTESACTEEDRDECMWRKRNGIDENALKCFYDASTAKLDATDRVLPDDALYMLMKNDYDFKKAKAKNRIKQSEEAWTAEDQMALGLAFGVVEKNFTALARMFPGKSVADIVERYYNTKKTVDYRGLRHHVLQDEPFVLCPLPLSLKTIPSRDSDVKVAGTTGSTCQNCGLEDVTVYPVKKTLQCLPCKNFFKATKKQRPCRQIPVPDDMEEVAEEFSGMVLTTGADLKENEGVFGPVTRSKARHRAKKPRSKKA